MDTVGLGGQWGWRASAGKGKVHGEDEVGERVLKAKSAGGNWEGARGCWRVLTAGRGQWMLGAADAGRYWEVLVGVGSGRCW